MKTSELTDAALDWAVAKCESKNMPKYQIPGTPCAINVSPGGHDNYQPSTDWSQGGPIIDREGVCVVKQDPPADIWWAFAKQQQPYDGYGPTPLIAAMRCYVASKLGDEVEIPEELK